MKIVCAVFDSACQLYGQPFFVPSTGVAIRSFADEVNRVAPDNSMNVHPEDFTLYQLSVFDDETGMFIGDSGPQTLTRAKDVLITAV